MEGNNEKGEHTNFVFQLFCVGVHLFLNGLIVVEYCFWKGITFWYKPKMNKPLSNIK